MAEIKKFTKLSRLSDVLHPDWRMILGAFGAIAGTYVGLTYGGSMSGLAVGGICLFFLCAVFKLWQAFKNTAIEWLALAIVITCAALTFSSGSWYAHQLPQEAIKDDVFLQVDGTIVEVEDRIDRSLRITFEVNRPLKLQWLADRKIRINVRTKVSTPPSPGCKIHSNVVLTPSPGPIVPGGYDFGRHALLQGVAAQGFAAGPVTVQCNGSTNIGKLRQSIAKNIKSAMSPEVAGLGAALITGDRSGIDTDTRRTLRDAGLAHLLAISGLHMGLITGVAFFLFEILFALIPVRFQNVPPRKLAATAAFVAALGYLFISGAGIATVRAFIMVTIAIIAVLTDRRVISLRSLSVAAIVILLMMPAAVVSISFHMSFAATAALVIFYERWISARPQKSDSSGFLGRKLIRYFIGVAVTSLVAQAAIAPFAFYHFQSVSLLGMSANLVAIPMMAFVIMPSALMGVILMPFGIEFPFWAMEQGLLITLAVAEQTSNFPANTINVPPVMPRALLVVTLGYLIFAIFRTKWAVLLACTLWIASIFLLQRPTATVLLAGSRPTIAFVGEDRETFYYSGTRRSRFREDAWRQYWNIDDDLKAIRPLSQCADGTCVTEIETARGLKIVSTDNIDSVRQACANGLIVVASFRFKRFCKGARAYLSKEDLSRFGPAGLYLHEGDTRSLKIKWAKENPFAQQ